MRVALAAIAVFAVLAGIARAENKWEKQSADLQQLLGEVQKVLPNGWHAAITPDVPEKVACEFRQSDATGLMIWRDDKAAGKYVGLRLPPGSLDAEDQPQRVFFQMVLMECLTPEQYQHAAEKNVQNDRQRREYQDKLIDAGIKNSVAFRVKAAEAPLPPWTYKPQSPEQRELVREYALLWAETEPRPLPTHFYRAMGFNIDFDDHFKLQDDQIASERDELRQAILKIVTAYGSGAAKNPQ